MDGLRDLERAHARPVRTRTQPAVRVRGQVDHVRQLQQVRLRVDAQLLRHRPQRRGQRVDRVRVLDRILPPAQVRARLSELLLWVLLHPVRAGQHP